MKALLRRERRSPRPDPAPDPREEFHTLWANLGKQRSQLFVLTALALTALIIMTVSYVRLAHSSKLVPYLYVVDRSGEVLALGAARPIAADNDAVIYHTLATFLSSVRAVYRDPLAQRAALQRAYSHLPANNPGASSVDFLETYMRGHDPRILSERFTRDTEIVSILKIPPQTTAAPATSSWRIRWRENLYPLGSSGRAQTSEWEAFATVRVQPKRDVPAFDANPFGVFVDHLAWSRLTPERQP
jgi:type IV secretory pathway TrbF-like protein